MFEKEGQRSEVGNMEQDDGSLARQDFVGPT